MSERRVPKILYKYRPFNERTISALIGDKLFFADPATFNDPLDTSPHLKPDISAQELKSALRTLVEERVSSEMKSAAKATKLKGPKTQKHIENHSIKQANITIERISYDAENPEYNEIDDPLKFLLAGELEYELLRRYNKGVFSMSAKATCPLMWSHYGDQHRGVAIGYSIPKDCRDRLHKVVYGGSRVLSANSVVSMMNGNIKAQEQVDETVLLRKAKSWSYECEWRLLDRRGLQDSDLELKSVVFGLRCPDTIRYSIIKSLENRKPNVEFREIRQNPSYFSLNNSNLEIDELMIGYPRNVRSVCEGFYSIN